ncbi:MAG TPA: hypothetical protein VNJ52_04510 [Patescibacteria group bacterium]|nr:hypothetical protein [Patescibacteria group bacterium]
MALPVFVLALATAGSAKASRQQRPTPQHPFLKLTPGDAATREGFDHFYNLEYEPAISNFEKSLADHPGDPYAINHLLEAVLFQELHREGKLDAELYMSNEFVHVKKKEPTAQTIARIQNLINQALAIENRRLAENPKDVSALYARSVTRGLLAVDQALVDKAWFTALRSSLGAYDDSTQVLAIDPSCSDAKLIVGIYNYVVGSLPWPVKIAALLATIHGSKSKGLSLIREAVEGGGEASVDARTTLGLFLAREHRYPEALELTEWLYAAFPRNFLYALSAADLLKDTGKPAAAIQAYRRLIELGRQGQFANENAGLASIELGNLLRSERHWRAAAEAYDSARTLPHPNPYLLLRAQLAAGQMYDLAGERQLAVQQYQEVVEKTSDPDLAEQARRWLKHPYQEAGD